MVSEEKDTQLRDLNKKLQALVAEEDHWLPNLANAAALLFNELENVNWAGFYLLKGEELILGPFQGLPACIRIKVGNGVCGSAVRDRKTYVVRDVHQFPGHIPCDEASKSEIVVPMYWRGDIIGVLDIDSPMKARFDETDETYLETFVEILMQQSNFDLI